MYVTSSKKILGRLQSFRGDRCDPIALHELLNVVFPRRISSPEGSYESRDPLGNASGKLTDSLIDINNGRHSIIFSGIQKIGNKDGLAHLRSSGVSVKSYKNDSNKQTKFYG